MTKPVTGQYECMHRSGVGLDYFTSRVDRLTLYPNGRFILIVQDRSRIAGAAQSFMSGQQVTAQPGETRREGNYRYQDRSFTLFFDDGTQEQGQIAWNGEGIQIGQNFFNKVSDSTLLPPTHRLQKDMDDIAKGLKIAGTIGGMALKAAKTVQETIQAVQGQGPAQRQAPPYGAPQQAAPPYPRGAPPRPVQPGPAQPPQATPAPPPAGAQSPRNPEPQPPPPGYVEAIFCDQCGARCRPGKRFCNNCSAPLT